MKDKTVAILESRARDQIAGLVRKFGGTPFSAPALAWFNSGEPPRPPDEPSRPPHSCSALDFSLGLSFQIWRRAHLEPVHNDSRRSMLKSGQRERNRPTRSRKRERVREPN